MKQAWTAPEKGGRRPRPFPNRTGTFRYIRLSMATPRMMRDAVLRSKSCPFLSGGLAREWNVNCQPAGDSSTVLGYLAPYVFKVAISDRRIVKAENRTVTFRYRKSHSRRMRSMTLDVMKFIRRFLQHVLPTGFMKVRYFGFMNPRCKVQHDTMCELIQQTTGAEPVRPQVELKPWRPIILTCPHCSGTLLWRGTVLPPRPRIAPGFG